MYIIGLIIVAIILAFWIARLPTGRYNPPPNSTTRTILNNIDEQNHALIEHICKRYPHTSNEYRFASRMRDRYDCSGLRENHPKSAQQTSYTRDKGRVVALCLRTPDGYVEPGILKFVNLHEMSHIGTDEWGHTEAFWNNFKFMLHEASEFGMYRPVDYSVAPVVYCGLTVDYNPMYDTNLDGKPC